MCVCVCSSFAQPYRLYLWLFTAAVFLCLCCIYILNYFCLHNLGCISHSTCNEYNPVPYRLYIFGYSPLSLLSLFAFVSYILFYLSLYFTSDTNPVRIVIISLVIHRSSLFMLVMYTYIYIYI